MQIKEMFFINTSVDKWQSTVAILQFPVLGKAPMGSSLQEVKKLSGNTLKSKKQHVRT